MNPSGRLIFSRDPVPAACIGGFYVTLFLVRGVASPFFPLWFADRGYSSLEISTTLALPALLGLVTGPLITLSCGRWVRQSTGLTAVAFATALGFMLLAGVPESTWAAQATPFAWVLTMSFLQTQLPLADVIAVSAARHAAPNYGQYRGLGTAAYLLANLAGGSLIARHGTAFIVPWCLIVSLGGVLAALTLPDRPWNRNIRSRAPSIWLPLVALIRNRTFLAILVTAGLIEGSHAYFYSFSSLLWRAQGASTTWIGAARALCAFAEVLFLFAGESWCRRIGPLRLLAIAAIASVVRWSAMGSGLPLVLQLALQSLHALSYTATFIAALRLVELTQPEASFAAGQSVCAAFIGGFVPGVGTLSCGLLYGRFATAGYFTMALIAALGCAAAFFLQSIMTRGPSWKRG
jgi:PPP family 3-phenylpropionic acid transporter